MNHCADDAEGSRKHTHHIDVRCIDDQLDDRRGHHAHASPHSHSCRIRIAHDALALVRRAAELQGRSISEFLVAAALKDAQRTIDDAHIIRLSADDQQRFVELLLKPPPLAPAMKRALRARKRLIAGA